MHSTSATAYYHPLPPSTTPLSPPTTTALILLALLALSLHYLGWSPFAPKQSLAGITEMAAFKLSNLAESVGLQGLGKVDWAAVESEVHKDKGKQAANAPQAQSTASGLELYPGLLNVSGNLCYLNATLQSMASLPPLLSYLTQLSSLSTPSIPTPVTTSLLSVLTSLNRPSTSRPSPLRPVALATALAQSSDQRRRLMSSSEQQDAHELWGMIREAVEEEEGRVLAALARAEEAGRGLGELLDLAGARPVGRGEEGGEPLREMESEGEGELKDPYLLLTSQRVKCMTCGYTRDVRHTSDQQVMLDVPHAAHISLYALLREHTKMDLLSDYACRKCSVLATLDKITAQRDRLALASSSAEVAALSSPLSPATRPTTTTTSRSSASRSSTPTRSNPSPFIAPPPSTPPAMTQSRRDRLRKTQKLVDRLQSIVEAGDWEKELGKEFEGSGKVERVEGPAGKVVRFARTPSILPIHLSRSTYYTTSGAYKNTCQVAFPEWLELGAFGDHAPPPSSAPKEEVEEGEQQAEAVTDTDKAGLDVYRLSSLVVHYGSHHFGHYVAFRRRPNSSASSSSFPSPSPSNASPNPSPSANTEDGPNPQPQPQQQPQQPEWYRISDETVSPSTLAEVLRANPVLLFYERWEGESTRRARGRRGVEARVVRRWEVGAPTARGKEEGEGEEKGGEKEGEGGV
ncbi:hypothetical protein BCR35DRAFT_322694 [Leucosporidium creatinivorum]|uniref:ubiquitinyl hydrolase 1 n=1 Tax=Leucosporidium creatinivorum TaxID=106004 RepID=A0A1Y2D8M6_9BASI|nr:hypothetical protein BCR35DRAFT_322694 [Leucosporidium creatinivorum]